MHAVARPLGEKVCDKRAQFERCYLPAAALMALAGDCARGVLCTAADPMEVFIVFQNTTRLSPQA